MLLCAKNYVTWNVNHQSYLMFRFQSGMKEAESKWRNSEFFITEIGCVHTKFFLIICSFSFVWKKSKIISKSMTSKILLDSHQLFGLSKYYKEIGRLRESSRGFQFCLLNRSHLWPPSSTDYYLLLSNMMTSAEMLHLSTDLSNQQKYLCRILF